MAKRKLSVETIGPVRWPVVNTIGPVACREDKKVKYQLAPQSSALLKLPAELRSQIYRHLLIVGGQRGTPERLLHAPGLLRTCRQLREESSTIYYRNNAFFLGTEWFSLCPQPEHWIWRVDTLDICNWIDGDDHNSWEDLMQWLQLFHAKVILHLPGTLEYDGYGEESGRLSALVNQMKKVVCDLDGLPWSQVCWALEPMEKEFNASSADV